MGIADDNEDDEEMRIGDDRGDALREVVGGISSRIVTRATISLLTRLHSDSMLEM
jgi:hypothetical protein